MTMTMVMRHEPVVDVCRVSADEWPVQPFDHTQVVQTMPVVAADGVFKFGIL